MATAPGVPAPVGTRPLNHRPHRPWLAAILSFIFPGLGQAYAGRPRTAAIFAIPVVLVITIALVLVGLLGEALRNVLLSSAFLGGVLVVNALVFGWRGLAIWDAGLRQPAALRGRQRGAALASVGALILLTLAMHGWVGVVVAHLDGTLRDVFDQGPGSAPIGGEDGDDGDDGDGDGEPAAEPTPQPTYAWDGEERINFLLLGTDAAPGRDETLTDVMLVLSIDPVDKTAAMISIPRDTGFVPLPSDDVYPQGVFPRKINELAAIAAADSDVWCSDGDLRPSECGIRTLQEALGLYVGLELTHYAVVDMAGFATVIDAIGGIELCLPGRLVDPLFDSDVRHGEPGEALVLEGGCHRYDGLDALAYARSRQGWIEMPDGTRDYQLDFDRNERQQLVLLAIREELADADLLFELPTLLQAVSRAVSTDFPRDRAGDLASLLPLITGPNIERVILDYPQFVDAPSQPEVNYLLEPRRESIREEMARLFGEDELRGWYLASDDPGP